MLMFISAVIVHMCSMNPETAEITIQHRKGVWMLIFIPLLAVAFASEMFRLGVNLFWWFPPLALFSLAFLVAPFRAPFAIVFRPSARRMELRFMLRRNPLVYSFDELDSIRSKILESGKSTYVQLEVCLKNGKGIALISEDPAWVAPFIGRSSMREPTGISNLRRKISSATGIKDIGFC